MVEVGLRSVLLFVSISYVRTFKLPAFKDEHGCLHVQSRESAPVTACIITCVHPLQGLCFVPFAWLTNEDLLGLEVQTKDEKQQEEEE